MSKVITLRLSEEEYRQISLAAEVEHRPISNFITTVILKAIESSFYAEPMEMAQINSDEKLLARLQAGQRAAKSRKGKFVE